MSQFPGPQSLTLCLQEEGASSSEPLACDPWLPSCGRIAHCLLRKDSPLRIGLSTGGKAELHLLACGDRMRWMGPGVALPGTGGRLAG